MSRETHRAECECGYVSPAYTRLEDAERDKRAHIAENPGHVDLCLAWVARHLGPLSEHGEQK